MNEAILRILNLINVGIDTGAALNQAGVKTEQLPNLLQKGWIERNDKTLTLTDAGKRKLLDLQYKRNHKKAEPKAPRVWKDLDPKICLPHSVHVERMAENRKIPSLVTGSKW